MDSNILIPVLNPNLPKGKVKLVAIGESYLPLLNGPLEELGITVVPVPSSNCVAPEIKGHADITFHHIGGHNIMVSSDTYNEVLKRFSKIEARDRVLDWFVIPSFSELGPKYPKDIALNALRIGKYLFCSIKHTDVRLIEYYEKAGIELVNVRQGYSRCSVCIVQEDAAITSDLNLAEAMDKRGISVLLVEPGFIDLEGYKYGFIGGASGKIAPDILCFTGSLRNHPSIDSINKFLIENGVRKIELTERDCFDIGSIIPLVEIAE